MAPRSGVGRGWVPCNATRLPRAGPSLKQGAAKRGEEIIWSAVRAGRLDGWKFKREVPFGGSYVADFSCANARLIIEVDGPTHNAPDRAARDAERDRWFRKQGWRVVRLSDALVIGSPAIAVDIIRRALGAPSPDPR